MKKRLINNCVTCGRRLSFFDTFCPVCGTKRYVQCPICNATVGDDEITCPECGFTLRLSTPKLDMFSQMKTVISVIFVILFLFTTILSSIQENKKDTTEKKIVKQEKNINKKHETVNYSDKNLYYEIIGRTGGENIDIEDMIVLSDLSSKDILDLREFMVKESPIFGDLDYTPSREVFDIEDNIPWISAFQVACVGVDGPNYQISEGNSRESLMILNPELLLHPLIPTILKNSPNECDESFYFIPERVVYHSGIKTITTYIDISSAKSKLGYIPYPYFLETANPRDLGYNSIFASGYYNIKFENADNNVSLDIAEPRGFWHKGYACGLPEGCNNYSPRDTRFEIRITELPAALRFKLWQDTPSFKHSEADLIYEIVFK
ncbi:hypothetical protein IKA15_00040 [bacterium]|nr:hypothetical protein [bacterium]